MSDTSQGHLERIAKRERETEGCVGRVGLTESGEEEPPMAGTWFCTNPAWESATGGKSAGVCWFKGGLQEDLHPAFTVLGEQLFFKNHGPVKPRQWIPAAFLMPSWTRIQTAAHTARTESTTIL